MTDANRIQNPFAEPLPHRTLDREMNRDDGLHREGLRQPPHPPEVDLVRGPSPWETVKVGLLIVAWILALIALLGSFSLLV